MTDLAQRRLAAYQRSDVELRKCENGFWEIGFRCPVLARWTWAQFKARNKIAAQERAVEYLQRLMRESATRWLDKADEALGLARVVFRDAEELG